MAMVAAGLAMAFYAFFPQLLVEHMMLSSLYDSNNNVITTSENPIILQEEQKRINKNILKDNEIYYNI
jgi:hypothetical protein